MADSHTITSAARLVRCHLDMRGARLDELTLPLIMQEYMEAFCYIWKSDQLFVVLSLPGTIKIEVGHVEIPGRKDAVNVTIACRQVEGEWRHWCALGKHEDETSVEQWVADFGNAYEMPQLWSEPATFALYRKLFHLENEQFQALGFIAKSGLEPYNAALAGVRWGRAEETDDPVKAYKTADAALPARMQVPVGPARQVYRKAASRPSVSCPDVVPMMVFRDRGATPWRLTAFEAICEHLVTHRGYSMPEVAARLGMSKSTVQTHKENALDKPRESESVRMAPTGAPTSSGPAQAGKGGDADSEE